jgi:hypothetical protein
VSHEPAQREDRGLSSKENSVPRSQKEPGRPVRKVGGQMSPKSRDRRISITSTPGPELSASVPTNRETYPIHDPEPAMATSHIASVLIPQFLDTPLLRRLGDWMKKR